MFAIRTASELRDAFRGNKKQLKTPFPTVVFSTYHSSVAVLLCFCACGFIYGLCFKCMKLAWSLKYGVWYSISSAVVKYTKVTVMIGQNRYSKLRIPSQNKKVREKSRECHNHKPQPFPDTKRKRKATKRNKHKSDKRTKSTKVSSLFPKRGNRNVKRTEKHKN